jgi:hypothetical protein
MISFVAGVAGPQSLNDDAVPCFNSHSDEDEPC